MLPSPNPPNFDLFLATPIIITSEMDESAFQLELARMRLREEVTSEFVAGRLEASDFFEGLAAGGVDVDECLGTWKQGRSLMI
jgi:hypothetical protein